MESSSRRFPPIRCPLIHSPNITDSAAFHCLYQERGAFYDGCNGICEKNMSFLLLNQGFKLEHFVYGYIFPVLVFLVVVANLLVVLVLSQRQMMVTPTNTVLKYMAISELFVGLVPLPWNFFYHTLRYYEREEQLQLWWCYMYKVSMDAIPPVCHNVAMLLTVLLAAQRYVSIQYPIKSKHICTVRNVRIATVIIIVVSLVCGLPKSIDYYYDIYDGWAFIRPGRWKRVRSCLWGYTIFVDSIGSTTFFNLYFWTRVFGFIVLPSMLLICLNTLLIKTIRVAQKRKERLLREKNAREAQSQTESNTTSIMLVVIVSIFLFVNLPQAFFMAMLCICTTFHINVPLLEGLFPATFLLVCNMLMMATCPINFGIYCFMSSSFREAFWTLLCRKSPLRSRFDSRYSREYGELTRISATRRSEPSMPSSSAKLSLPVESEVNHSSSAGSTRSTWSSPPAVGNGKLATMLKRLDEEETVTKTSPNNVLSNGFYNTVSSTDFDDLSEKQQLIGGPCSPTSSTPETIFL